MTKDIEAIIFDMDGVLFDTERIYLDIWTKVFKKYKYEMTKDVYVSVMGTGRKNVMKTFLQVYGDELPIDIMYKEKDEELFKVIDSGMVPMKVGAYDVLIELKQRNFKLALATSAKRERVVKHLVQESLEEVFDFIVCGDEISKGKPNPEIFLKAAKGLRVESNKCIVIEDSLAGIEAACNANMISIHVEDLKEADNQISIKTYRNLKNIRGLLQVI